MKTTTPRYLSRIDGDFGLDGDHDSHITNLDDHILGIDEPVTDQVQALHDSLTGFWGPQKTSQIKDPPLLAVPEEPQASSLLEPPPYSCYGVKVEAYDEFADGCRLFVWRNSQWHPVSSTQLEQVKENLSSGHRVFHVSEGEYSWTVDARKHCDWEQISSAGTRRSLRCTPTIFEIEDTGPGFVERVTAEWHQIVGAQTQDSKIPDDGEGVAFQWYETGPSPGDVSHMKFDDLMRSYRNKSSEDDSELLFLAVDDLFNRIDFCNLGYVTLHTWMHFRLLESQAPSRHAIHQMNQRLSAWTAKYSQILSRFIELFLQSCEDTGNMRLTASQMKYAVRTWLSQTSTEMFTADYLTHLHQLMNGDSAFEEGETITYFEFLDYMTGQSWSTVELYFYDLTKGSAGWWTPVLFGHQMPCLWHCGIVVSGKEYRYGGNIFESKPGCTAFGKPLKIETIGSTCRTRQDTLSFINRHLAHQFAVDSYQILSNNSNHFCDTLSMYLTNQHITSEVLQQPEVIMSSTIAQSLSSWMPWLKGTPLQRTRLNRTASEQWESIEVESFVNYEYEDGWTLVARVVAKREYSCDLCWYSRQDFQFHTLKGVTRRAVQPLFGIGNPITNLALPQRKF